MSTSLLSRQDCLTPLVGSLTHQCRKKKVPVLNSLSPTKVGNSIAVRLWILIFSQFRTVTNRVNRFNIGFHSVSKKQHRNYREIMYFKTVQWQITLECVSPFSSGSVTAGILTSVLTPLFIRSMRMRPRDWRAPGHREKTWSFTKVFFKFPKCFLSRLFQFFFPVLWISNGYLSWYLWVDSASYMIKRFVVVFIVTAVMCRHSPLQLFHNLMDLMDCWWLRLQG